MNERVWRSGDGVGGTDMSGVMRGSGAVPGLREVCQSFSCSMSSNRSERSRKMPSHFVHWAKVTPARLCSCISDWHFGQVIDSTGATVSHGFQSLRWGRWTFRQGWKAAGRHTVGVTRAADLPYFDHAVPLPIAHRGGALYEPNLGLENTRHAFANAIDLGYRYLETDVHASRDGVVYAFHDATLDRVTDRSGRIAELAAADVERARIAGREPIPTMAELFEAFPAARFNIDVKEANAVEPTAHLVESTKTHDRVCLASFSVDRIRRLRRLLGPRVATSMGTAEVARLRSPVGFLRRLAARGGAACVQVPHRIGRLTVTTRSFVAEAHRFGLQVHVWTVNDAQNMIELLDIGVDGIITDRIDTLRDILMARERWDGAAG
jgi:glycerophosphoryl diester phosphodiesterase